MPFFYSSETGGDVDRLAFSQSDDGLLHVLLLADEAAETLYLALADERVDRLDLHAEQRLDGSLDLGLGSILGNVEDDLVLFGYQRRLFGDRRRDDHIIVAKIRHLNRSSRSEEHTSELQSIMSISYA